MQLRAEPRRRILDGVRVLIVDDEEDICQIVLSVVCAYGAEGECAMSAAQARTIMARSEFDVLLIDIKAPTESLLAGEFESSADAVRLRGQVSQRSQGFEQALEHDTVLQPWLCGGPLVNLEGKAIGLNIARAGRVTTYALPAKLVKKIIKNLQSKTAA